MSFITAVQQQLVVGNNDSFELSRRAIERDDVSGLPLLCVILGLFGLVVLAAVLSAIWKSSPETKSVFGESTKSADNLFLAVGLFLREPSATSSVKAHKVYLRSISRRRAVLLSEQAILKGQELWLSFKDLPYFHSGPGTIHCLAGSVSKLGPQWYVCELKLIHDSVESDAGLKVLINDLRAVPG